MFDRRSFIAVVLLGIIGSSCASPVAPTASQSADAPQTLTVVVAVEPTSLDGVRQSTFSIRNTVTQNFLEPLATLDPTTRQAEPLLAKSWERVDPKTWRVALRTGVKFHDGTTMTADDVVASIDYALAEGSPIQSYVSQWAGARKLDSSTVEIAMKSVNPILPLQLQYLSVASAAVIAKGPNAMATAPIGTGPYQISSWTKGSSLVLTRFEGYWGNQPAIRDVTFLFRTESSVRADMVRTGEAQLAQALAPSDLQGVPRLATVSGLSAYILILNAVGQTRGSVMQDGRVRKAVAYAIDRKALRDQIYGGQATLLRGNIVTAAVPGYNDQIDDYPFDAAKASSLVKDAGVSGKPVSFVCGGGRFLKDAEACQLITAQLNSVGLSVKMSNTTAAEWQDVYRNAQKGLNRPDILIFGPANDAFDFPSKTALPFLASLKAGGGAATVSDAALDQMIATAVAESDLTKRKNLSEQISKYVNDRAYLIPLLAPNVVWGTASNLDFTPLSNDNLFLSSVRYKR